MIHQRAVVTGAGRGIGRRFAELLVARGTEVVVADVDSRAGEEAAKALGPKASHVVLDVADGAAFERVVTEVEERRGPIDFLVSNAGIMLLGPFLELSADDEARMIRVNLSGVINGMRAALPRMLERRRGHILNVASLVARLPAPYAAVYAATKAAVAALTESTRLEHAASGVKFTCAFPGVTRTELILGTKPPPWPPIHSAEDVAHAALDAVDRGLAEVYAPGPGWLAQVSFAALPGPARDAMARLFRVDRMFRDLDVASRARYDARSRGRSG
ncbi:MAG: SDR family NAD(P)-dependent oxidoreductase [Deltaproteobacteria bacterium]|nr:SDR family NAD(P)-dependent oxidoreductase [Deltaproteobacteria bacterium]